MWRPLLLLFPIIALAEPISPSPKLQDFLGVCGHTVQFHPEQFQETFSLVRDYHPVSWDLDKNTSELPPWPAAKNRVDWNHIYSHWKKSSFESLVSLMIDSVPSQQWSKPEEDAHVYGESFAREFGPHGRNLVPTVEIGNEPGKYSDADYQKIFESMASGLRAGDPAVRIATCNTTVGPSGKYSKSLSLFDKNPSLYDIITVHSYAQSTPWPTFRRSYPEDEKTPFLKVVRDLIQWRDQHAPGKPVWVTEFGWDACSHPQDRTGDFKQWEGNVSDEAQAAYLIRAAVLLLHAGAERGYIYFFNDDDAPHMHGSSGILRKGQPKASWYALRQFRQELGDYRLTDWKQNGDLYQTTWKNDDGKTKFLIWRGVSFDQSTVSFDLPSSSSQVISMTTDGQTAAISPAVKNATTASILIGPSPVYIIPN